MTGKDVELIRKMLKMQSKLDQAIMDEYGLDEIESLKKLSEKGYFKGIDPFTKVHDIIDNCEVIE